MREVCTILLVDDHEIFRQGLRALLEGYPDLSVVGDAADGPEALERARALRPDLVLMDIRLTTVDGLRVTTQMKQERPETKVIILTSADGEPELVYKAIRAGATGYLAKMAGIDELVRAIRSAVDGDVAVAPAALNSLFSYLSSNAATEVDSAEPTVSLSAREGEVLALVAEGLSNRQIADRLSISENTVNSHVRNILSKLNLDNRVQAATYIMKMRQADSTKGVQASPTR